MLYPPWYKARFRIALPKYGITNRNLKTFPHPKLQNSLTTLKTSFTPHSHPCNHNGHCDLRVSMPSFTPLHSAAVFSAGSFPKLANDPYARTGYWLYRSYWPSLAQECRNEGTKYVRCTTKFYYCIPKYRCPNIDGCMPQGPYCATNVPKALQFDCHQKRDYIKLR